MELYNLNHPEQKVNFKEAVTLGLGINRGLFFPTSIPKIKDIDAILDLPDIVQRSQKVIGAWLGSELGQDVVDRIVANAFTFTAPLVRVDHERYCLELFHGPTLAFKDFGARFMAQCLNEVAKDSPITILTATSGDTGAAVAHAFYGLENIKVVVLFPKGKISELQQKLFTTLGKNIYTVAVESDFDACQDLVKKAFEDPTMRADLHLNSANSINISRLLAQICYYFEAVAQFKKLEKTSSVPVVSVPSGNFGNLTAGLFAKAMGLPIGKFIAATNNNDTVPRYLRTDIWHPMPTVATISNAMDVSDPSNWPRVEAICKAMDWDLKEVVNSVSVTDGVTKEEIFELNRENYLSEPHTAIASYALLDKIDLLGKGIFLSTAHPAKFKDVVDEHLKIDITLPKALADVATKECLAVTMPANFAELKEFMYTKVK